VRVASRVCRRRAWHHGVVQRAVIRAALYPASRCANIHRTTGAVTGSGSRRCARLPQAACALSGCGPASPSRYRTEAARQGSVPAPGSGWPSRSDPDSGPGDLPLGRQSEGEHGLLVILGMPVDPPAHLRR
jgi:hypothetical protein